MKADKKTVESVTRLLSERAEKYRCGYRTAFIQWTSEQEKQGVTLDQVREYIKAQ